MATVEKIIETLDLEPHPEGGYYRETYRATLQIPKENLGKEYSGSRHCSTCIYYLLTSDSFSSFHRIKQDETWHFYEGGPVELHLISPEGDYSEVTVGNQLEEGHYPQFMVPGGYWFAGTTNGPEGYSLVGCTVSPGFDFEDFELGERRELIASFPKHQKIIERFTRI